MSVTTYFLCCTVGVVVKILWLNQRFCKAKDFNIVSAFNNASTLQCNVWWVVTKLSRRNILFLHAHQKIYRVETAGGYDSLCLTFSSASQCVFYIDMFLPLFKRIDWPICRRESGQGVATVHRRHKLQDKNLQRFSHRRLKKAGLCQCPGRRLWHRVLLKN